MADATCDCTRPRGRPRSEAARCAILAAAAELLEQGGADGLTMEAIAQRAGVSKATIYRWWPNKAAVLMESLLRECADMSPCGTGTSAREGLRLHLEAQIAWLAGPTGQSVAALLAAGQQDPALLEAFRLRYLAGCRAEVAAVLERGVACGELRAGLDLEAALDVLLAPLYLRLLCGHAPLEVCLAGRLVELALDGIAGDGR